MNAKKLISMGITLAALSMLTACEAGPVTPGTPGTPASNQPGTPQTATSNATMNILPGEGTQAALIGQTMQLPQNLSDLHSVQKSEWTEADNAAYQGALQLNDLSYCDRIKNETLISKCKTEVSDKAIFSEALSKLDNSFCLKLSSNDVQEACKTQIDVKKQSQAENQAFQSEVTKYNSILENNQFDKCSELTDKALLQNCEDSKIAYDAVKAKNSDLCLKITNQLQQQQCIELVKKS